ncbi:aldo/keto reductase [Streptomyces malaysiensis]|uniref:Aldo/keto reductase n=1 Tax=Streptomyces malaysiensis subsp. samsunensis TaxID=459658 RepID=A0A9X2M6M6_STRMQ|nr:aldo/keto reductase [Streptomyces samsunensis]
MNRRRIGRTGVHVTELGFGSAPIGNLYAAVDDEQAQATVDAAWQAGVRYFDTAPHYGLGLAEQRLGQALATRPRAEYVISTKVGRLLVPNDDPRGTDLDSGFAVPDTLRRRLDYSAAGVRRSIEDSLTRLGVDHVDIVLVHDPELHVPQVIAETVPELLRMRDEGLVSAVGVGMNYWQPLAEIVDRCDVDAVMLAGRWTLLDRSGEPLLHRCAERGVSVLAAAPFNSGILARTEPGEDDTFDYAPVTEPVLRRARELAALCRAAGIELAHAALGFPLRRPEVASVVAGMASPDQVRLAARRVDEPIPDALWSRIRPAAPLPEGAFSRPPSP